MAVVGDDAMIGHLVHGRYEIVEFIARGGMASVFRAQDTRLDREVAVKIMHQGLGDPEQFTDRFKREARSAARLNHNNVVSVFDQGQDGPLTYLVMEYVPGRTLREVMRDEAPMPSLRALDLVEQILIALVAAHDAGIVHRDIKPENVLITPDGAVKVADFGLARAVSSATTATGNTLIGTVSYLAPEVVVNAGTDARSDVYAVGAMTYEMLTGIKPHHADTPIQVAYKHVHEDIGPPSDLRPGLPDYIDALVARATCRDRDKRSTDARVLLNQLRRVQQALREGLDDDPELAADLLPYARPGDADPGDPGDPDHDVAVAATAAADEDTLDVNGSAAGEGVDTQPVAAGPAAAIGTSTMVLSGAPSAPGSTRRTTPPSAPRPIAGETGVAPTGPVPRPAANDRHHSRGGRRLLVLVLVLALLAGLGGWYFGIGRYDKAPSLVNMTEQQAAAKAKEGGYTFTVASRAFSEKVPVGSVISTDPEPGGRILPGGEIEAVVSKGPERYQVPDLRGATLEEAETILADTKLELGDVTETWDQEVPEGHVIGVDGVAVGDPVKRETKIDVIVSLGREPLEVTDYTGQTKDAAVAGLQATGFEVAVTEEFSDGVSAGTVISQNPASGTHFRGDTITIVVSKGPELYAVPDVNGMRKDEAEKALTDAGFTVSSYGPGNFRVRSQSPDPGTLAKKGTNVTIIGF